MWHLHRPCRRDHQVSRLPLFLHGRGPPASAPRLTNKNASCDSSDPSRMTGIGRLSVPKGWTVFQIPSTRTVFETTSTPLGPETPPLLHIAHRRSAAAVRPSLASRGSLALPLEHRVARPLDSRDKHVTNHGGGAICNFDAGRQRRRAPPRSLRGWSASNRSCRFYPRACRATSGRPPSAGRWRLPAWPESRVNSSCQSNEARNVPVTLRLETPGKNCIDRLPLRSAC